MPEEKPNTRPKIVLTRKRFVRGKEYKPDTVIAELNPMKGFDFHDVRKALLAGDAALVE
jgi:hypothetical protein